MKRILRNIAVTGGAGFIGSNFIHYVLQNTSFSGKLINIDKLTYASNLKNLQGIPKENYVFQKCDICDFDAIQNIVKKYDIDMLVHFAAESHVDNSISSSRDFIQTNIIGTSVLLEVMREHWQNKTGVLFHHVSTDEVYGSLGKEGYFYENSPYSPRNPYAASKASSDHLVRSYFHTYQFPITISNCSNNIGPRQYSEKLIPMAINKMKNGENIPIYGDGKNIRDWLYVEDHCEAIWKIVTKGSIGETYNIGGENEWENIKIINLLCETLAQKEGKNINFYKKYITFVEDRKGHDFRYAVNCDKIKKELNWQSKTSFLEAIDLTVDWYC